MFNPLADRLEQHHVPRGIGTLLGILIEGLAYKPLRGASPLAVLITAIGVSYLLQNLGLLIFGADTKSFKSIVNMEALFVLFAHRFFIIKWIITIVSSKFNNYAIYKMYV